MGSGVDDSGGPDGAAASIDPAAVPRGLEKELAALGLLGLAWFLACGCR
jgi:hypothetical protein